MAVHNSLLLLPCPDLKNLDLLSLVIGWSGRDVVTFGPVQIR
jgi:hypothetical protein